MRNSKRAQSITEVAIIGGVIGIIALAVLIPFGGQISSYFKNAAPVKTGFISDLFGSSNASSFNSNYSTLNNSSNSSSKAYANNVENAVDMAGNIKSGQTSKVSDQGLFSILNAFKSNSNSNTQETSGSVANFITSNLDSSASDADKSAASALNQLMNKSQVSLSENTSLASLADSTANMLKAFIQQNPQAQASLIYSGASYTSDQIKDLDSFFTTNMNGNNIANLSNVILAIDNVQKSYTLSGDLAQNFADLKAQTKAALSAK